MIIKWWFYVSIIPFTFSICNNFFYIYKEKLSFLRLKLKKQNLNMESWILEFNGLQHIPIFALMLKLSRVSSSGHVPIRF